VPSPFPQSLRRASYSKKNPPDVNLDFDRFPAPPFRGPLVEVSDLPFSYLPHSPAIWVFFMWVAINPPPCIEFTPHPPSFSFTPRGNFQSVPFFLLFGSLVFPSPPSDFDQEPFVRPPIFFQLVCRWQFSPFPPVFPFLPPLSTVSPPPALGGQAILCSFPFSSWGASR